jgi:hypothetical protein
MTPVTHTGQQSLDMTSDTLTSCVPSCEETPR